MYLNAKSFKERVSNPVIFYARMRSMTANVREILTIIGNHTRLIGSFHELSLRPDRLMIKLLIYFWINSATPRTIQI